MEWILEYFYHGHERILTSNDDKRNFILQTVT